MRPERLPLLRAGSRRPPVPSRGLALRGPDGPLPQGVPAWLHVEAVVDGVEPTLEAREAWLRGLFVVAADEDGRGAVSGSVLGGRALLRDPAPPASPAAGAPPSAGAPLALSLQLALADALGPVGGGRWHVHVAARGLRSNVIEVTLGPPAPRVDLEALVLPGVAAPGPSDLLLLASAHLAAGDAEHAARRFHDALAHEENRADLDRGALYDAARAVALALPRAAPTARAALVEQALAWLREDVERRRRALGQALARDVEAEAAGALPPARRARFERLRADLVAHVRRARVEDPALAPLRRSEFEAVFAPPAGA